MLFFVELTRGAFFFTFLPLFGTENLGLRVTTTGFAISVHYLAETVCKPFAGSYYDRWGCAVLPAGMLISVLALAAIRLNPSPMVIIAACAIFGLGISPLWPGVITEVAPVNAPDRSLKIGMVFSTWLAGTGSGMIGINFLMAYNYNFSFNIIVAILTLALFLAAAFSYKSTRPALSQEEYIIAGIKKTLQQFSQNTAVTNILLPGMFLQTLAAGLLIPILPVFARTNMGLNYDQYGLLLLAGGAAAIISLVPMGKIADKINLKFVLSAGFILTAASIGLLSQVGSKDNALYLVILLGVSYAAVLPAWNSLMAKAIPPERQATGWGVFATVEGMGIAIGPALGGMAGRWLGIEFTILITTALLLGMSVFYLLYPVEKLLNKNSC
jgi:predicted MFS family arabinose efflux permease